jgi:MFS transporter, DHA1 family, multidrug resistance protein
MFAPGTLAMTVLLALLTALGPLSTDLYLPSLPAIARTLDTTTAGAQATLSAFLVGFAVGQIGYGPVSDRLGRRPVLLAGLVLFGLASAACAAAPDIVSLTAARFLQALGASGPIVLARAMVRDLYEGPRAGRELSRMSMIMGVVPALAPVLGGVLQETAGWRANFVATLVLGAALTAAVALRLPETLATRAREPLSLASILRGFGQLLRHRAYRAYVALTALAYGGLFAFISGSSFVLQGVYGLSALAFALSFSAMVIGFIGGTVAAQRLVARHGLDGTIAFGVAAMAAGGTGMAVLTTLWPHAPAGLVAPMALYAAGVGLTMPFAVASALAPFPTQAGAASSLLGICQMTFAAGVGVALAQALTRWPGLALPLPLAVAAIGLTAFGVFHASRRQRAAGG